ncbi:3-keto-5-aminohexanoate cleavage protein [Pseudogemmobacter humi]|uniref:3-keto-5-aminohexanoate cleavage enzyme n=1 Tax=Pseudogemmobacter humi TaxID=2483812 RepID=A0A3P5WT44_9RHOB|nr:3-keto-5-aminohexanoate cleavage protein [Pseudogemmobacter humi]VDC22370.1 3-keto-5-aminohexanoate cleavage enzyme [Pseudogemmobacter humi]
MSAPVIITCAVTGGTDHAHKSAAVPVTPEAIAASALDAAEAGAAIVHIHVRDPVTTLASTDFALYEDVTRRIRQGRPDLIINLTTGPGAMVTADQIRDGQSGAAAIHTPESRVAHITRLRPEICSLDIAAMNFGDQMFLNSIPDLKVMARLIREAGVMPELEAFDLGHLGIISHFLAKDIVASPPLVQIGLGVLGGASPDAHSMSALVRMLPAGAAWAMFGVGRHQFPVATQAMLMGGHVRVGLEDNLWLEDGVLAESNAALVAKMVSIMRLLDRRPATTAEARAILGLRGA